MRSSVIGNLRHYGPGRGPKRRWSRTASDRGQEAVAGDIAAERVGVVLLQIRVPQDGVDQAGCQQLIAGHQAEDLRSAAEDAWLRGTGVDTLHFADRFGLVVVGAVADREVRARYGRVAVGGDDSGRVVGVGDERQD